MTGRGDEATPAGRALGAEEERLRILIESTPAGVAMLDRELRYIACSRRWISDYHLEGREVIGRRHYEVFPEIPERWREIHRRCLAGASERCDEDRFERADGSVQYLRWAIEPWRDPSGAVGGVIFFTEDVTERKRLEDQFRRAQRMEALGTLAGGIAHDFNNLLGVIVGSAELASAAVPPAGPAHDRLADILAACARAAALVRQILTFSRKQPARRVVTALAPVAAEVARLLRAGLPAGIQLVVRASPDAPSVHVDPDQVHQVLMNLGTNAWHAIERPTGTITIGVDVAVVGAGAPPVAGLPPGRYARLQVSDDGAGMPAAVIERIFEPFFTTKGVGRGSGLGLAVAHGIVADHGGGIAVESAPGRGATFSVYLPEAATSAAEGSPAGAPPAPRRGAGRVLLIDDEELLVRVTSRLIEALDYDVEGFVRAADALAALRADPRRFDVVLTDQHMPELGGLEVARAVAALRPGLPVVLASGNQLPAEELAAAGVRLRLDKPFTLVELGEALAEARRD